MENAYLFLALSQKVLTLISYCGILYILDKGLYLKVLSHQLSIFSYQAEAAMSYDPLTTDN